MLMDGLQSLPSQQISLCFFLHRHLTYVKGASFMMTREKKLKEFNPHGLYSLFILSLQSQFLGKCQAVSLFICFPSVFVFSVYCGDIKKVPMVDYLLVLLLFPIELIITSSFKDTIWQILRYFY